MNEESSHAIAVLTSGGFDSAILATELAKTHEAVHPLFMRAGLKWETVELEYLQRFLAALHFQALRPLVVLEMPCQDLYGRHWSLGSQVVPGANTPDEAVYLPGRNLLLLLKGMLWCQLNQVPQLALGILRGNPFPDATPSFFQHFMDAVNEGMDGQVRVVTPYAELSKTEVLARGQGLPLGLTFSCIHPIAGIHCGACNKCAERQQAFKLMRMPDPTTYATAR